MSLASRVAPRIVSSQRTGAFLRRSKACQARFCQSGGKRAFQQHAAQELAKPMNPEPRHNPTHDQPPKDFNVGQKTFADFDLKERVFIVTGGSSGLGLELAEAVREAGGIVYCLDVSPEPSAEFIEAQKRSSTPSPSAGSLTYRQQDVADTEGLDRQIASIASTHARLDGVVAAAGIQQIMPAAEYTIEDLNRIMAVNYAGVFMTATAAARQMFKHKCHGSMVFIASMSRAAVLQLARNLAMEWSPTREDGSGGIRVNCISPGHILTPMVQKNFEEVPGLREKWESENTMGRLAETREFKGAALFLLSNASSFMTGSNLIMDGGHTAW
ncbi:cyclopentanol dehydrogenase [Verticillium alfalfae VaMs.102]|uniref:Cyclopentanol dehydrogenase n=1 Tax=Verticillium alfalfae (strain VaMs.102 / ATCC MYA-4576 / FGSC 10136) TaxID=526221 RepID=C9SCL6_VERA1|nr:cyclopentanol dehydrogenase [Verticillium alfalfae VaMs.102]EEY16831.1 cyclopentanol dehydrogenase [Verticillium alfalfae VaMs.102]